MSAMMIGSILGFIVGAATATVEGAFAGAVAGMFIGLTIYAARWAWAHSGDSPVVESHRLLCTPHGTYADCQLLGDSQRRRWLDVKDCSLQCNGVTCEKTCLRLMNDTGVKPGKGCH